MTFVLAELQLPLSYDSNAYFIEVSYNWLHNSSIKWCLLSDMQFCCYLLILFTRLLSLMQIYFKESKINVGHLCFCTVWYVDLVNGDILHAIKDHLCFTTNGKDVLLCLSYEKTFPSSVIEFP